MPTTKNFVTMLKNITIVILTIATVALTISTAIPGAVVARHSCPGQQSCPGQPVCPEQPVCPGKLPCTDITSFDLSRDYISGTIEDHVKNNNKIVGVLARDVTTTKDWTDAVAIIKTKIDENKKILEVERFGNESCSGYGTLTLLRDQIETFTEMFTNQPHLLKEIAADAGFDVPCNKIPLYEDLFDIFENIIDHVDEEMVQLVKKEMNGGCNVGRR